MTSVTPPLSARSGRNARRGSADSYLHFVRRHSLAAIAATALVALTPVVSSQPANSPAVDGGTPGSTNARPVPANGSVVVIGGALDRENGEVYQRILRLSRGGQPIGVVPTASGSPETSGPEYVGDFVYHGGAGRGTLINITKDDAPKAFDAATVQQLGATGGLFFTGGDQSRIVSVFRPASGDTPAYDAALQLLASGGVISGSSAGAAMMSDPMLRWGTSAEALMTGSSEEEDKGVGVGRGMGLFPYGLTDQHFLARGRYGRLIAALEATGERLGFGVDENRAFYADLRSGRIEAIGGPDAVLVIDMAQSRRTGLARRGIRVSLLAEGDVVDGNTGVVYPAGGKTPMAPWPSGKQTLDDVENAWASRALPKSIRELALHPAVAVRAFDENFEITLTEDADTRFWHDGRANDFALTAINVRLDIVPKPGSPAEAADAAAAAAATPAQ